MGNDDVCNGTLEKIHAFTGQNIVPALVDWPEREQAWLAQYYEQAAEAQVYEVVLPPAVFLFDCIADRVMLAYGLSTAPLMKRDASRIRGFPNVNASVKSALAEQAFVVDKGHLLGHASGGQLDINLFPQRRELNRGWSLEGKLYRQMEAYVAANLGTFSTIGQSTTMPVGYLRNWNMAYYAPTAIGGWRCFQIKMPKLAV